MRNTKPEAAEVMRRFESIGDSCEFGFVQSHFGVEPISLLRWSGCSLAGLARGLERRFDGLFLMENLTLAGPGLVADGAYDITFHRDLSFDAHGLARDEANLARYRRHARDMAYRVQDFLEALEARERIYVFSTYRDVGMADLLRLKAALDLHGPQRLLVVVPATAAHPRQEVRLVASGVKIAGMARVLESFPADSIDFGAWADVCAQAVLSDWGEPGAHHAGGADTARPSQPGRVPATDRAGLAVLVSALYRTLLLREPEAVEIARTVEWALARRMNTEQLIAHFLHGLEFSRRRRDFLRHYDPGPWPALLRHVFRR